MGVLRAIPTPLAWGGAASPALERRHVAVERNLSLSSERTGREATVTVKGEVDCATAPALAGVLQELLAEGTCRVTVDLAGMTFIDSSGLATLVSALKVAREGGGDIVLHSPGRCVRKVLEISGAARLFVLT